MDKAKVTSSWLLPVLRRIRKRPGMYLGDDRLRSLSCHVLGAFDGLACVDRTNTDDEAFLRSFGVWLGVRLGIPPESQNGDCWFYLIECRQDREAHIERFYEALDQFLHARGFERGLDDATLDLRGWKPEVQAR